MISASVSFSPYSNYPSAPLRPQAQKGEVAPENQEPLPDVNTEKKAAKETSSGQQASAKEDPEKARQDQKLIEELKKIDRNVRAHEQAHLAAAGGLATSGASFTYRRGPDGQQYAVGGEVSIDVSSGRTPQETISKAERIQAAALAPADPSAQDRAVAGNAAKMKAQAQQELAQEKLEAAQGDGNAGEPAAASQAKEDAPPETGAAASHARHGIASYRANSAAAQATGGQINYAA